MNFGSMNLGILRNGGILGGKGDALTEFGLTPTFLGRTSYFDNGANEQPAFAAHFEGESGAAFCTSGGTGRGAGLGIVRVPADLGAADWDYKVPGTLATSRIALCNGESSKGFLGSDADGNLYATFVSDDGLAPGELIGGILSLDKTGALRWWRRAFNSSNTIGPACLSPDGTRVICQGTSTWFGEAAGQVIVLDASDGSTVAVASRISSSHRPRTIFGADQNLVVSCWDSGTSSVSARSFDAHLITDYGGALQWTLDKIADFTPDFGSTVRRVITRHDGGLLIVNGDANNGRVWRVSEDGVVEGSVDVLALSGVSGTSPIVWDAHYDRFGHLYVLVTATTGADIVRLDAEYNLVWAATDFFAQANATSAAHTAETPLLNNAKSITVDHDGVIYVGEGDTSDINTGFVAGFSQG